MITFQRSARKLFCLLLFLVGQHLFLCAQEGGNLERELKVKRRLSSLAIQLAPYSKTGTDSSRRTYVIRGSITQTVPFVDPIRVKEVYVLVKIESVLKNFVADSIHDKAQFSKENEENFLAWPSLKKDDVITVRLPRQAGVDFIGSDTNSLVFLLTPCTNRILARAKIESANLKDVTEERRKADVARNLATYCRTHNLGSIPEGSPWFELIDEGLCRDSFSWDEYFERIEVEASLAGLLRTEEEAYIQFIQSKATLPDHKSFLLRLGLHYPTPGVRIAAANKLLKSGCFDAVEIYSSTLSMLSVRNVSKEFRLPGTDIYNAESGVPWRESEIVRLHAMIPEVLVRLRSLIRSKELESAGSDISRVQTWLQNVSREKFLFDDKDGYFYEVGGEKDK